jgi:CheY-like chemotaxis protein
VVKEVRTLLLPVIPKNIKVNIDLPKRNFQVLGDSGKIHQCLLNLCLNAKDALGSKHGKINLKLLKPADNEYVIIEVEDTGPGIPPNTIERIFDPFFSTKPSKRGTGLGLSVVYGIVRGHNGKITVDSRPGEGTTFRIELPAVQVEKKKSIKKSRKKQELEKKQGTVMIIDDEVLVRGFCDDVLKDQGYATIQFGNGQKALSWFERNAQEVRFAIADIIMPQMDGIETVEKLRAIRRDLKVIWMTGYVSPNAKKPPEKDPFLTKPFTPVTLVETVENLENKVKTA